MPRVRSMMKNTTAQNVDPERVEIASGYRIKTKPAPGIEKGKKRCHYVMFLIFTKVFILIR